MRWIANAIGLSAFLLSLILLLEAWPEVGEAAGEPLEVAAAAASPDTRR